MIPEIGQRKARFLMAISKYTTSGHSVWGYRKMTTESKFGGAMELEETFQVGLKNKQKNVMYQDCLNKA